MRLFHISIFFLFVSFQLVGQGLNFEFGMQYCNSIEAEVSKIAAKYQLTSSDVLPIVYPECCRFNKVSDAFETDILTTIYVDKGSRFADFSVGLFQMKPSFLEKLDSIVSSDTSYRCLLPTFCYKVNTVKELREKRLNRIMNQTWQIEYVCLYVLYMKKRFQNNNLGLNFTFYLANAYNFGFTKSDKDLRWWSKQCAFPSGRDTMGCIPYGLLAYQYKLMRYVTD